MKAKWLSLVCVSCLLLIIACSAFGQVPRTLSYQGRLTNDVGIPLDGTYSIAFSLYDVATGGTALWSETKNITVSQGLFTTALGDTAPFGAELKFDNPYFIGVKVGAGSELTPRQPLQSAPYALALPGVTVDPLDNVSILGACTANALALGYGDPEIKTSFVLSGLPPNVSGSTDGWRITGRPSYSGGSGGRPDITLMQWTNTYPTETGSLQILPVGGSVGIGTTQPRSLLDVNGGCIAEEFGLRYDEPAVSTSFSLVGLPPNLSGSTNGWRIIGRPSYPNGSGAGPDVTVLQWDNSYPTDTGTLLLLPSGGNVGIGTASPTTKLGVGGSVSCTTITLTSSQRFKKDVEPITDPLDIIGRLQGVSYTWDEEHGGKRDMGFVAEDVAKVLPELVTMEADGKNAVGMDYAHLIALAIEGIKAQQEEIEALKAENAELISAVRALQERSGE